MNYYLLQEHWSSLVRKFKDEERKQNGGQRGGSETTYDNREAEQTALFILDYIRYTKLRQYNLFTQKRGEEFERMMNLVEDAAMARRYMEDDERWETTLEFADQ